MAAVAGIAEESPGATGMADLGAGEAEGVRIVESVVVSGVEAEVGAVEASWGVAARGVEVCASSGAEVAAVGVEESREVPPSLPVEGTACASDDVPEGVPSVAGVKTAEVPLTGVAEVSGVGINRGGFSGAGFGTGLVDRWIR